MAPADLLEAPPAVASRSRKQLAPSAHTRRHALSHFFNREAANVSIRFTGCCDMASSSAAEHGESYPEEFNPRSRNLSRRANVPFGPPVVLCQKATKVGSTR